MADIKDFARELANEAGGKLAALAESDKMQLHKRRVMDAEGRPFWKRFIDELALGIAEYESCLNGTAIQQQRIVAQQGDEVRITWRYPRAEEMILSFNCDRRLIEFRKHSLNSPAIEAKKEFRLSVDKDDNVFASASDANSVAGGPTEVAKEAMRFMLAGSMV